MNNDNVYKPEVLAIAGAVEERLADISASIAGNDEATRAATEVLLKDDEVAQSMLGAAISSLPPEDQTRTILDVLGDRKDEVITPEFAQKILLGALNETPPDDRLAMLTDHFDEEVPAGLFDFIQGAELDYYFNSPTQEIRQRTQGAGFFSQKWIEQGMTADYILLPTAKQQDTTENNIVFKVREGKLRNDGSIRFDSGYTFTLPRIVISIGPISDRESSMVHDIAYHPNSYLGRKRSREIEKAFKKITNAIDDGSFIQLGTAVSGETNLKTYTGNYVEIRKPTTSVSTVVVQHTLQLGGVFIDGVNMFGPIED